MRSFVQRYQDRIVGIISGFDRVLFRGTLRSISFKQGMDIFLSSQKVLYKRFTPFAQEITNQVKAHAEAMAQKQGRPFHYLGSSRASKEEYARAVMERDGIREGLICVLSCVEPCQSFTIRKNRETKQLELVSEERKCLHLYFYYVDREFGFMHIRLQTWLPLTIQVCLNGREWLGRRMERAGIGYEQCDNCFPRIDDVPAAQQMLDALSLRKWKRLFDAWARRVNGWLKSPPAQTLRGYYWTMREGEYATDVMFRDAASLAAIYPALVRHAIEHFGSEDVLRFFGHRRPVRFRGEVKSQMKRRWEGVRVKHWVDENWIKMYDKQGSVLRVETTINNPRRFKVRRRSSRQGKPCMAWLPLRKGVVDIRRRVQICRAANERYFEALAAVAQSTPARTLLDPISQPVYRKGRRYRPLRPISPQDSERLAQIQRGEFLLNGFRNRDLQADWANPAENDPLSARRTSARISRWIGLLRAHRLIYRVQGSHFYRITQKGHSVMTTAADLREVNLASLAG